MTEDWAPFMRPVARNIALTGTVTRLDFPPQRYLVNEPIVLVTVNGARTEVTITYPREAVTGVGEVYTHIVLTVPADLVGKRANVYVIGS